MKFKFEGFLTFAILFFSGTVLVSAEDNVSAGYHGVAWGTSLKEFKSSQKSFAFHTVDETESKAIDYLMMNFHEVDKDDESRPIKFADEKTAGENVDHIFYDGQYRLAAVPIAPENVEAARKEIQSKYAKKDSKTYSAVGDLSPDYGSLMTRFDYQQYAKTPETSVYLVTMSSYYGDGAAADPYNDNNVTGNGSGLKNNAGAFLIYVSNDYFKNTDNAWTDYQANLKAKPEKEKEVTVDRHRQDLGSIE
jgi:hypothetical protein